MARTSRQGGFTLIEILIVISIIAILMGLLVVTVMAAKTKGYQAIAQNAISSLSQGLDNFYQDESFYPGRDVPEDENAFPELFEALLGQPKTRGGKAGRSAPYAEVKDKDIRVIDRSDGEFRMPTDEERWDPETPKYMFDPWGNVYWYRVNKNKDPKDEFRKNKHKFDIWSVGANKLNESIPNPESTDPEKFDDIGNW